MNSPIAQSKTPSTHVFPNLGMVWVEPSHSRTEPETLRWSVEPTAAGELLILESHEGIVAASFTESARDDLERWQQAHPDTTLIPQSTSWIPLGNRNNSSPPTPARLAMSGTPFQKDVWRTLLEIPWGETRTYGWIAKRIGRPNAYRAVGSAVGSNPIALLVPCHRILPSTGLVGNYGGGRHRKIALLKWEGHENLKYKDLP